ncbi:tape measure protein [Photobacterium sp. 1_MG-2023]|uniref:tape measure protein n=1 Tax=Photobacterium sp. 1_MG-2023 TaxID=3062646 RepID=UPI0026E2A75A|nr:tape measure protein [Photobacterium sp. 1_MG-2023]MDO6706793.1 tape measure protein [Photobacterium sp. 1_MG-2023]
MTDIASLQIRVTSTGIAVAGRDLDKLAGAGDRAERATDGFSKSVAAATVAVGALTTGLGVRELARYSDAWKDVTNRLTLATNTTQELEQAQQAVFSIAQDTRSELGATAILYQKLSMAGQEHIQGQQDLAAITQTVNKAVALSGSTAAGAEAAIIQLSQGLGAGALRGEEFNSVLENAPRLIQLLADSLGVPIGKMKELASNGQLTSERVIKAIRDQSSVIDSEYSRTLPKISEGWTQVENSVTRAVGALDEATGASQSVYSILDQVSSALDSVATDTETLNEVMETASDIAIVLTAVVGGKLTGAMISAIAQSKAMSLAVDMVTQSTTRSSQAVIVKAQADKAALQQQQLVLASMLKSAQSEKTATAIREQLKQNTTQLTAANQRLDVALKATTTSGRLATTAMTGLRGAMAFLGGPVGVAITAATAIALFASEANEAKKDTGQLTTKVDELSASFRSLNAAQRQVLVSQLNTEMSSIRQAIVDTQKRVDGLKGTLNTLDPGGRQQVTSRIRELESQLKNYQDQLEETSVKQQAVFQSGMPDDWEELPEKPKGNKPKNELTSTDGFEKLRAGLEEEIALYGETGKAAQLRYRVEQGELKSLSEARKQSVLEYADVLEVLEEQEEEAKQRKAASDEFEALKQSLMTEEELIQQSYQRRKDTILAYTEATEAQKTDLLTRLEQERSEKLSELNAGFWDRYLTSAEEALGNFDELATNTIDNLTSGFGNAFESMIFDAQTFDEAMYNLADGMARSMVNALGKMATEWLAYQAVQMLVGKTTAASSATSMVVQAQAASVMAGLNAYSSTAAIPVTGPAAAPAASAAAVAATEPMAATVASLSAGFAGLFDNGGHIPAGKYGIVGEFGPEIVNGPANVTSREDTMRMIRNGQGGGNSVVVKQTLHFHVQDANGDIDYEQIARLVRGVTKEEIANEMRPGGMLSA